VPLSAGISSRPHWMGITDDVGSVVPLSAGISSRPHYNEPLSGNLKEIGAIICWYQQQTARHYILQKEDWMQCAIICWYQQQTAHIPC